MAITTASQSQLGQDTAKNSQIVTTSVKLVNSGASTGPSISSIVITDSSWDALDDTAVGTSNSYIKILGSNFTSTSNVYIGGVQVATANVTFVSSSELRVTLPPSTAGVSNTVSVFTSTGSGTIAANTLLTSGFPSFTSTSYSSFSYTVSTQLSATGDGTLTYSLKSGSTLPAGLSLAANGLISGTVSGDTTNTFTVLVNDAQSQTTQADITLSVIGTDSYFKNNMLLISADGTNNANNNVFVDSSNNNFVMTRTGNTTQGSLSPFSTSGWSNYFDGNGDYLTIQDDPSLEIGSNSFTIEAWICLTGYSLNFNNERQAAIITKDNPNDRSFVFSISGTSSSWTSIGFSLFNSSESYSGTSISYNFSLNTWYHVAVSRNGTSLRFYVDGVDIGGGTYGATIKNTSTPVHIGSEGTNWISQSYGYFFPGHISNLRFINGSALYTSNFTPPTTQLTAIANTVLLTCQSNRFLDTSNNAFAVTVYGDSKVSNFNPFSPVTSYSSTYGGSAYLDGTGDWIGFPSNSGFAFGTGSFTIEFWVYTSGGTVTIIDLRGFDNTKGLTDAINSSGYPAIYEEGVDYVMTSNKAIQYNAWNHVAYVRNGSTFTIYVNGASGGSVTNSTNWVAPNASYGGRIGANKDGNQRLNGYVSNLRVVKGAAIYTSNFTPPTAPVTADSNTQLLLNFTNAGIFDATQKNIFETLGNAKLSTSVKKYGTASLYLDGSNSYLKSPTTINMGTSDFTIEAWVYPTSRGNADGGVIVGQSRNGIGTDYLLYITQSGYLSGYFLSDASAFYFNSSGTVSLNTWTHVALTRSGSTFKLWINGVNDGTTTSSATITNSNGPLAIGYASNGIGNGQFFGYIDDLRITRGVARYVANFTPPANLQLS